MALSDAPLKLKPYIFHGVNLRYKGESEPVGTCPFCDRENKFHVSNATGMFHCKMASCESKGNIYDFIRKLHELSVENCDKEWLADFSRQRGISVEFLEAWGIVPSYLTGEVIVPAYNVKGKVTNLYHWLPKADSDKKILYSTPTLKHGMFGMGNWDNDKRNVTILEGPWSGSAMCEILSGVTCQGDFLEGGTISPMFLRKNSLEADWNVVGIPGCNNFRDVWSELFSERNVLIVLDNDHPTEGQTKKGKEGWKGTLRTARILLEAEHPPLTVYGVKWGDKGYTDELKSGYDPRDALIDSRNGSSLSKSPKTASKALKLIAGRIIPLEKSSVVKDSNGKVTKKKTEGMELAPEHCESFQDLRKVWRLAFKWTKQLDMTLTVMMATAASTSLSGTAQLWLRVMGPPGSGKSTLCEALSVSNKYTFPRSIMTGFHSGARDKDGESCSAIPKMNGKTVIIKDGDTLLNGPNRDQALAELRDIYDGTSRASYRNSNREQNYTGLRITFILGGTKSLKRMNRSFLGDRFLDCIIYEKGDNPGLEANILKRSAYNALKDIKMDDESIDSINNERMTEAMCLTAGYLHYLRESMEYLVNEVTVTENRLDECIALGNLTSLMRARPDKLLEEEDDEVELPTRLTAQYVRLASCVAVVLNKQDLDEEVMSIVRKIAHDTCRGITWNITKILAGYYPQGLEPRAISGKILKTTQQVNASCRFLSSIGVVRRGKRSRAGLWVLEDETHDLLKATNFQGVVKT